MNRSKKTAIFIGSLLTFLIVFYFVSGKRKIPVENSKLVKGMVTSVKAQKGLKLIQYTFSLNETKYSGEDLQNICVELGREIIGKEFAVIYDKYDPNTSSILISKKSFDKYDVSFPDSLKWVIETCH